MFSKILVPLDGTPEAAVALTPARTLARTSRAALVLVRAIGGDPYDVAGDGALAELEAIARELRSDGLEVETLVLRGAPAEHIVAAVGETGADLVAMATHGRHGLGRAILGSVAECVVATSPVPVLLLRPGGHKMGALGTILVPVDGTPGGAVALGAALGLARATGARLVLLQVVVPLAASMIAYEAGLGMAPALYPDPIWDDEALAAAETYVGALASRLRRAGVRADGNAAMGAVAPKIVETAEAVDADLIVMSTHALTGPIRTVLGSVADAVVRTAPRPVLLVRRDAPVPGDRPTGAAAATAS